MTRRHENGMAIITVAVLITIILLSLCACSTKQHVAETVYVHDTVFSHHTDTVVDVKIVHQSDTVREHESHTYTINNVGDTLKEIHYYYEKETERVTDSTYRYQAERDSLRHALHEAQSKEKTVVKEKKVMAWWGWLLIGIMAGPCVVATVLGIRKRNSTFI